MDKPKECPTLEQAHLQVHIQTKACVRACSVNAEKKQKNLSRLVKIKSADVQPDTKSN